MNKPVMRKTTRDEKIVRPGVYEVSVEQAEQESVAETALKNCIYFDSIDFNQTPPYLRYDTGDSTPEENWTIYCDIQEDLRKNGYELTDSDVDHDTVCGDVTPIATPVSIQNESETDSSSSSMRTTVRTKDLTDDEISKLRHKIDWTAEWSYVNFARAVIAADREKNK